MRPDSKEARIEVTTRCNFNCIICPHDKLKRKPQTMNYKTFLQVLDRIQGKGYETLTFSGIGEPLLDTGLSGKIWAAKDRGYRTLLLTNGSWLFPNELKDLMKNGLDSVRISFYGMTPMTYMKMHGVPAMTFEMIKSYVHSAIESEIEVILTYNVIPGINDTEIDRWKEEFAGADLLEIWYPHNWSYGMHFRLVQKEKLVTCGRPFKGPLQVQVDGTVIVCCFDYDGELVIGDLKTQTLDEIFSDEPFTKIRNNHLAGDHGATVCVNCDQRNAKKDGVMIYSSRDEIRERVHRTSTTYEDMD